MDYRSSSTVYSPHSVLSEFASVPSSQAVQEVMLSFLYLPAGHNSEGVEKVEKILKASAIG